MKIDQILKLLIPKEKKFFHLFNQSTKNIVEGSEVLINLVKETNKSKINQLIDNINKIELKNDEITHKIMIDLDSTFVTPLDREDIHKLTIELDDIIDGINDFSKLLKIYKIESCNNYINQFGKIIFDCSKKIELAVSNLDNLLNHKQIKQLCVEIKGLEEIGDNLYDECIINLFENEKDSILLIKYKDIYDALENVIDSCENISDVIESIIIKST